MGSREGVTVLLPVARAEPAQLERAFASMQAQTCRNIELLLVLNGSDDVTRSTARRLCASDDRAWMIELEQAGLAAALNAGLSEASHELVARMDADDACSPDRIERQVEAMRRRPDVAALGTSYEIINASGDRLGIVTPPADPAQARWRLLISNPFAHGSMMLRRSAVLALGGYDESFERAQDYDLWVRLSARGRRTGVCALPDVLYTLTRPDEVRAFGATSMQGVHAARVMMRAWERLSVGDPSAIAQELATIAERGDAEQARRSIEQRMEEQGPTLLDLMAWLWGSWTSPGSHVRAFDAARTARVREVGRAMRARGVAGVWLWGAGRHTDWLLAHADELGVPIIGIVDDALFGHRRFGYRIDHPQALGAGEHVLLSSDWHEEAMWSSSDVHRKRGVIVWRIYGTPECSQGHDRTAA